jgi:hypothetical protein
MAATVRPKMPIVSGMAVYQSPTSVVLHRIRVSAPNGDWLLMYGTPTRDVS